MLLLTDIVGSKRGVPTTALSSKIGVTTRKESRAPSLAERKEKALKVTPLDTWIPC